MEFVGSLLGTIRGLHRNTQRVAAIVSIGYIYMYICVLLEDVR